MKTEAMERHLSAMFNGLVQADEADERREYMNAMLRITAMVIDGSQDPEVAKALAFRVIEEALNETGETVQ